MGVITPEVSDALMLAVIETAPEEISTLVGDIVKEDNTGAMKSFCACKIPLIKQSSKL